MLVLTRKTGQKLIIGGGIEIKILETHGDSVKIGIEAPKDVPIYREELYLEICNANRQKAPGLGAVDEAMALVSPSSAPPNVVASKVVEPKVVTGNDVNV